MLIKANFDEIADEVFPIPPGVYTFNILEASVEETKKDPTKDKVVLKMEVVGGEHEGRQQYEHIGISSDRGLVTLKQIILACGLTPGLDLDTSDLVGQTLQARIKARTYTDAESGEVRETSSVAGYLWKDEEIEAAKVEAV